MKKIANFIDKKSNKLDMFGVIMKNLYRLKTQFEDGLEIPIGSVHYYTKGTAHDVYNDEYQTALKAIGKELDSLSKSVIPNIEKTYEMAKKYQRQFQDYTNS